MQLEVDVVVFEDDVEVVMVGVTDGAPRQRRLLADFSFGQATLEGTQGEGVG